MKTGSWLSVIGDLIRMEIVELFTVALLLLYAEILRFILDGTVIGYYQGIRWLLQMLFLRPEQKYPISSNVTDDGKIILSYYVQ